MRGASIFRCHWSTTPQAGPRRKRRALVCADPVAFSMGHTVASQRKPRVTTTDRVYPRDLHPILQGLWDPKPFFQCWPKVELPPKPVFDEIVDVCYHASMLPMEGRPTVFRIADLNSKSSSDGGGFCCTTGARSAGPRSSATGSMPSAGKSRSWRTSSPVMHPGPPRHFFLSF